MKRQATIKKPWPAVVIPRANDLRYEIAALVTHRHIRNLKTTPRFRNELSLSGFL